MLGAHGIRGWLKIQSYTEPPENLARHRVWTLCGPDGRRGDFEVAQTQFDGRWLKARIEGIDERNAAEALRGLDIEVARDYYREDLVGFRVLNRAGMELGLVGHFIDAPATPIMVVVGASELWVPAVPSHLVRVDLERRVVEVEWPEEL